jgi:hypothetical protein
VTPRDVTTPNPAAPARPTDTEIIERAEEALDDLCSGKRRWTMTVPPEVTDQDLVFSDLIVLAKRLLWNDAALAEARAAERRAVPSIEALAEALRESVTFRNIRAGMVDTEEVDCRGLALQLHHILSREPEHFMGDDCTEDDVAHFDAVATDTPEEHLIHEDAAWAAVDAGEADRIGADDPDWADTPEEPER